MHYPVEVDMNWSDAACATIALGWLAGCAGYENVDAKVDAEAAPDAIPDVVAQEADPEQYRISVEIPVEDVTIDRGENLDVDALLDERTSFRASDFHLREVVLIARSRRGGSAELLLDEWASGAVDIPEGAAESWYEVRIPAADVGEAGVEWVIDFTGALDLNLLVAVLEPRSALLAAATATVREIVVEDEIPADQTGEPLAVPPVEVVQSVEVVEPVTATPTVVKEVAVVEQPVYRTQTIYRYVDRPVYRYHVSWIYDPARYYVFRDYGGWTYRYFPGTWDWRCYNPSFRLPIRYHHHNKNRHRADRHDGRRYERRDRDDRRGDRDRRRGERDRDVRGRRDGDDRDRRGVRPRGSESRAVVSRPSTLWRRVDPGHPRIQLATQRRAEPRVEEDRWTNARLRTFQGTGQSPNSNRAASRDDRPAHPRLKAFQRRDSGVATNPSRTVAPPRRAEETNPRQSATTDRAPTEGNVRTRSFERREARQVERRPTVTDTPRQPTRRPTVANRVDTFEPRQDSANARTRAFQRRPQQRAPSGIASPRTTTVQQRPVVGDSGARAGDEVRRSNPRTRVFQREADRRSATRSLEPRRTPQAQRPARSTVDRPPSAERERGNARTRAFQQRAEPRVVAPQRNRADTPRPQSWPRSTPPVRSTPPARPQRVVPSRNAPQRQRPVQRAPVKPKQNDSASDARPDEGRRSNSRSRTFERR
ncbi:MAG: hypothetical protein OXG44_01920 [Gammaproteobacteria bacterium]|nr:hypothetical protein [Gammaproteobacteria bacterium]